MDFEKYESENEGIGSAPIAIAPAQIPIAVAWTERA